METEKNMISDGAIFIFKRKFISKIIKEMDNYSGFE